MSDLIDQYRKSGLISDSTIHQKTMKSESENAFEESGKPLSVEDTRDSSRCVSRLVRAAEESADQTGLRVAHDPVESAEMSDYERFVGILDDKIEACGSRILQLNKIKKMIPKDKPLWFYQKLINGDYQKPLQ